MKVICKKTKISSSDLEEIKTVFIEDFDYKMFGLELEQEYLVMGMLVYQATGCIYYLTDVDGTPRFFPYLLFDVSDNKLPSDWYIKVFGRSNPSCQALWGFRELCEEDEFYERLMEQEDDAMMTYFRRRLEREKQLEESKWLSN